MEKLFEKLKEYLHMETEIPYEEFTEYYRGLLDELNANFNSYDQDTCIKAKYICSIVQANAESRAQRSKSNAKAYKKIAAKCGFWSDAIAFRLRKEGMTQADIDKATEAINESI
ncbi:MAG: hypothetical protein M0T74_18580 [Desulfitobacterium hafniense]|nr:hypothetical protein [Desulfitobacterium hafniense]